MAKVSITREQQLQELTSRVTPIVNVDIIIQKDDRFLVGHRNPEYKKDPYNAWLFPGGRMKYFETPQETALRKLAEEVPGVSATLKKLVTVISDKGYDHRAYGVTIYYLFEYESGEPCPNEQLDEFQWLTLEEMQTFEGLYELEKSITKDITFALQFANTNEDELLVRVNKEDEPIGKISKREAHSSNAVFHRSALIAVFNQGGEVILHQRSKYKSSSPLKWDLFGGHNNFGTTIDITARQELLEELGVDVEVHFSHKVLKQTDTQSEFMYFYYAFSDGPYAFDRNEVAQVQQFDAQKVIAGDYDTEYEILDHVKESLAAILPHIKPDNSQ